MASKTSDPQLLRYVLRIADTALILGQRLIEYVTHGPELEEELANANFSLDYLGQARMLYSYAGELEGKGRGEDDFAMLRDEREFENLLLVEQPNGHFGDIITRAVLFETFYVLQLEALAKCTDEKLAAIAARAARELHYHVRFSHQWFVRLGDGTDESRRRIQESLQRLWQFSGEMFAADENDLGVRDNYRGPDLDSIYSEWRDQIESLVRQATLTMPEDGWMADGGRQGLHGEEFGFLIAEMQYMQRSHPGLKW